MSDPIDTNPPSPSTSGPQASEGAPPIPRPTRAGEPAPRGSAEGRARLFRRKQAEQRSVRRGRVGQLLVVAIIVLGIYAIVSARPFNPASGPSYPSPGSPITVSLAPPVLGNVTCAAGGIAYTEQIVWNGSTSPVTTGDISVHVIELFDGDFVPDRNVVANVTSTNLCAGSPPNPTNWMWYVVMTSPNGTIQLTYTVTQGWTPIAPGPSDVEVQNGSALTVVTGSPLNHHGLGFAVVGFANGSQVHGLVPL